MAKIELQGFFHQVDVEGVYGESKVRVQRVLFRVPAYTDRFGDKNGEDEYWEMSVMGSKIDDLDLLAKIQETDRAKITVYVNPKVWFKKEDVKKEEPQYSYYAILYAVEHVALKPTK